jgi:hypothetical protein
MKKLKKISPLRIVFLIVLVAGNTFAWFIYSSKIDTDISVHVKAWDVVFESDENEIHSQAIIDVGDIYPGMDNFSHSITAYNRSEVPATMSYKLLEASILGDTYVTVEGRQENGDTPLATDPTSAELIASLEDDYPFTISFDVTSNTIAADSGQGNYVIGVVWPYESGDDETDTEWGIAAATFKEDHPSDPSISLKLLLTITQNVS